MEETIPLPIKYRNPNDFLTLVKRLDRRLWIKCSHGYWNAERIGIENTADIESAVFRKDRGTKCTLFSPFNSQATLEAVISENKRKEEVIDRKKTRQLACIAIIISAFATLLAAIIPFFLSRR